MYVNSNVRQKYKIYKNTIFIYILANKGRDACQSISNAILLDSTNVMTRRNKFFYLKLYEKTELFVPSPVSFKIYYI